MEFNVVKERAPGDTDERASKTRPKDKARAALSEDDQDFFRIYVELTESDPWNVPINKVRHHLHFISIYIRALQFVGIMGETRCIPRTIPNGIREGFEQWARYFYGIDEIPEKKPRKNGTDDDVEDDKMSYRQLTVDLFNAALANANFVVTTWRIKYKANALLTGCDVVTESCQWRSLYSYVRSTG